MLLRRKPKVIAPGIEAALCMQTFRPGAVAVEIKRGERLPLDHPAVTAYPSCFVGVVSLPLEEVK